MARAATSRNFLGFGRRKPAPRRRTSPAKRAQRSQEKLSVANLIDRAYAKGHDLGRMYCCGSKMRPSDSEVAQQFSDWISGQNVSERIRGLKATPRAYKHDPVVRHVFGSFAHGYSDAAREANPAGCARTLKSHVSDRAKRYRANQKGCRPSGAKNCKLCGSRSDVMVDHVDGNESNGRKSNLRWLCRSCNNTLAAEMAREGRGRRTVQYNPAHKGALTLGEYMQAVLQHTRGSHDSAGKIIHETPKSRRKAFASEIWARRESHGTARPGSSSAGYDEPDWVRNPAASREQYRLAQVVLAGTARSQSKMPLNVAHEIVDRTPARLRSEYMRQNPESSTEYRLGYNLGQTDRQTAQLRKTDDELTATCRSQFPNWQSIGPFISGYDDAYLGSSAADERDAGGQRGENSGLKTVAFTTDKHGRRVAYKILGPPHGNYRPVRMNVDEAELWVSTGQAKQVPYRTAKNPAGLADSGDDSEEYRQAKKTAELFHGRPVQEEIEVEEKIKTHDWYVAIGPLIKLVIKPLSGKPKKTVSLPFSKTGDEVVHLFCSPDGRQFYLRGGDQELDLKALGMGEGTEWFRDQMLIGEAKEITYRDRKKFHKFDLVDYYHKLGEVTKKQPMFAYDSLAHKMSIIGGQYKVELDDLTEGMSPGIVN